MTACGDDATPVARPPGAEPRAFCDTYRAACERQVDCGVVVLNHAASVEACVAETECGVLDDQTLKGLGVSVDELATQACIDALGALSCEQVASLRYGFVDALAQCTNPTVGTRSEGESCVGAVYDDCEKGLHCSFEETCPGTCVPDAAGCLQGACGADEFCSYLTGACEPLAAVDAACEGNAVGDLHRTSCVEGSFCSLSQTGWACEPRRALGESCESCSDPTCCQTSQWCNFDLGQCVDRAAEGAPCQFPGACPEGMFCDFSSGECSAQRGSAQPCSMDEGACRLGLACIAGTCRSPGDADVEPLRISEEGGTCSATDVCPLGTACLDAAGKPLVDPEGRGACRAELGRPGDECSVLIDPHSCEVGLCDFVTSRCPESLEVGASCGDALLNASCPHGFCVDGRCAAIAELTCETLGT